MNNSKLSVIIRCKNEERWIGHCIQSVLDNIDYPEILIVDNHSSDDSMEIVKSFKTDLNLINDNRNFTEVKIVKIDDYTPGKAINLGVKNCTFDNILIISAHCVINSIKLSEHISDLDKYSCVFGNQNPIWRGKKIKKRYVWSHFIDKKTENMFSSFEKRYFFA